MGWADIIIEQCLTDFCVSKTIVDGDDDKNVCERLRDAFESVAKEFVDGLINKSLMQKMELMERIPKVSAVICHMELVKINVNLNEILNSCAICIR